MAEAFVPQLRGFWGGFPQCLPWKSMTYTKGICKSTADRLCYKGLLQQIQVQKKVRKQFRSGDWCYRQGCPVSALLFHETLTGLCGKQHRTLHRASNEPSSQPWRCGFHRWSSVWFTHSSAHGRENHRSEHVCTTSMPEDQSKEDTSMVAETCLHWKIFKFVRIIFDFSFYNFDLFLICFEKVKASEAKK